MPSYHPDERLPAQIHYCLSLASAMAALHLFPIIPSPLLAWRMLNTSAPSLLILIPPPLPPPPCTPSNSRSQAVFCVRIKPRVSVWFGDSGSSGSIFTRCYGRRDCSSAYSNSNADPRSVWLNLESTGAFIRTDSKQITFARALSPRNDIAWR